MITTTTVPHTSFDKEEKTTFISSMNTTIDEENDDLPIKSDFVYGC